MSDPGHHPQEGPSVPDPNRRLPTRVSNACQRCRRNKSRCDLFRPCSLCVRANVDCESAPLEEAPKGRPKNHSERRASKLRKRPQSASTNHARSVAALPVEETSSPREDRAVESVESDYVADPRDQSSSWTPLDYGESESAMGIARKIYRLGSQTINESQTSAIPDGGPGTSTPLTTRTSGQRLPISTILGGRFPDIRTIHLLLEEYFEAVHWFSLVIYEPKFRQRLLSIEDGYAYNTEAPFLTLLSTVLGMAAWYQSKKGSQEDDRDWRLWSDDLLKIVEMRLVQVMDQRSMAAVQTLILLGSHHVYHGRPNLSFALLGATIKMSHDLGLHRNQRYGSVDDVEERKRVWWTIYTWDRFASISYGRPLSINDEDFNVEMPAKFTESPFFTPESMQKETPGVCYSPYQTELTQLYIIASPALRKIFGSLTARSTSQYFDSERRSLMSEVTQKLSSWRRNLPPELSLNLKRDYNPATTGWGLRACLLQSLSLQLTFDNLLIVLHRPFLARQIENLSTISPGPSGSVTDGISPSATQLGSQRLASQGSIQSPYGDQSTRIQANVSSEHWWDAAVRTASVTELPQLTQLATDSHLVAFVAMNLFNAAIVLILVALSDPLSDQAQAVKRPITRVFRLQELLAQRSPLSSQSSIVLKDLICLLLRRERDTMIGPTASTSGAVNSAVVPRPQDDVNSNATLEDRPFHVPPESVVNILVRGTEQGQVANPSFAQRLNESLVSVQQIIPPFQDETLEPGSMLMSRSESTSLEGQPQQSRYAAESFQGPTESLGHDANAVDYGANGLFWLWDSSWSDLALRNQPR
ncbi:hypothetical protein EsH8_IX_000019 [Colletotrichum jinshuiense]